MIIIVIVWTYQNQSTKECQRVTIDDNEHSDKYVLDYAGSFKNLDKINKMGHEQVTVDDIHKIMMEDPEIRNIIKGMNTLDVDKITYYIRDKFIYGR